MADTKITALTALTAADPANDVIPIVDVSDTTMAASGTTKKISVNNILGASGTATLASATITGDLTVDTTTLKVDSTNNRVGIGTASPLYTLDVNGNARIGTDGLGFGRLTVSKATSAAFLNLSLGASAGYTELMFTNFNDNTGASGYSSYIRSATNAASNYASDLTFGTSANTTGTPVERLSISSSGVFTFQNVGGAGTAMTLNSTGLGVGVTPAAGDGSGVFKAAGTGTLTANSRAGLDVRELVSGNQAGIILGAMTTENTAVIGARTASGNIAFQTYNGSAWGERMRIDYLGNVGIGVTPSTTLATNRRVLQIGGTNSGAIALTGTSGSGELFFNSFFNSSSQNICVVTGGTGKYDFNVGTVGCHTWSVGTGTAGNAFTFTQAMTLDASGNLLVGTTTNTNNSRVFARGTVTSSALALQGATGDVALAQLTVGKFDNNTTASQVFVRFTINDNSGGSGQINANGASQAAFGSFSDSRLKENILSLPSQLANILSLRPVEFDYKDGSGHQVGFVAQEMQEIYSDAVGERDGFLTVTGWSKTEARLVSAIKELAAKVQALEAKLA